MEYILTFHEQRMTARLMKEREVIKSFNKTECASNPAQVQMHI